MGDRKKRSATRAQEAQLRVAIAVTDGRHGLVWSATLHGHDLYAGTADQAFQFAYHESGKGHVHFSRRKDRLVMPPSVPIAHIAGAQKVGGWAVERPKWGYKPKPDTAYRKTAVLHEISGLCPPTIDLWLLEANRSDLADGILHRISRDGDILATLHIDAAVPELFAVVWAFPAAVVERAIEGLMRTKAEADAKAGLPSN